MSEGVAMPAKIPQTTPRLRPPAKIEMKISVN
jgi:hypothetical protein